MKNNEVTEKKLVLILVCKDLRWSPPSEIWGVMYCIKRFASTFLLVRQKCQYINILDGIGILKLALPDSNQ